MQGIQESTREKIWTRKTREELYRLSNKHKDKHHRSSYKYEHCNDTPSSSSACFTLPTSVKLTFLLAESSWSTLTLSQANHPSTDVDHIDPRDTISAQDSLCKCLFVLTPIANGRMRRFIVHAETMDGGLRRIVMLIITVSFNAPKHVLLETSLPIAQTILD